MPYFKTSKWCLYIFKSLFTYWTPLPQLFHCFLLLKKYTFFLGLISFHTALKVHKIENFFWLRIWILYYFIVSCAEILRFVKKNFDWAMIGGDTIVPRSLRLRGIEFSLVLD